MTIMTTLDVMSIEKRQDSVFTSQCEAPSAQRVDPRPWQPVVMVVLKPQVTVILQPQVTDFLPPNKRQK